ncbi:putative hydroxyindole O-methyltransferase [Lophiotrema nucula]|uniref:Putative hydroxyindole O-methyltransferase n=1 Tax=Lophiotrema nucula TaxID=690887 RepID=A0A6A5Z0Z0_9PLEO|nr:putative hydroxyindole O-methyltransferase [Lophiotrema nucula]
MNSPSPDITTLLKDVDAKGKSVTNSTSDDNPRKALLESARSLVTALETPFEVVARMNWFDPPKWAMTRIGYDLNLFDKMLENNRSPKSCEELGKLTGADPKLLSRMLKHLYCCGFVNETGSNEFAPNAITAALATRICKGMTIDCYDLMNQVNAKLPEYLKNTKYQNPTDKDASIFQFAFDTKLHYFEWLSLPEHAAKIETFNAHMDFKTLGKKWFQSTDVSAILNDPSPDPESVLMIDIGGNAGHDIVDFKKAFPEMKGRLVLQELPAVINSLTADFPKDIEAQEHDMFTPQPIHGAKAYYLHMVLHDWPDDSCRQVLAQLVPAMKNGYSKILLNEIVIKDKDADWFSTSVDMLMMLCHSAYERTESDWRALCEGVGLRVSKIWDCEGNPEKVIEIELA